MFIPTGEISPVQGTPFDFRQGMEIGEKIKEGNPKLKINAILSGYDTNFILNKKGNELSLAARLEDARTGRVVAIYTTEPAIQFIPAIT